MYRRFGNSEFFCGGTDGRIMLDDILAEDNGTVLGIRFWCKLHYSHSNANLWLCYLYAFGNGKMNGWRVGKWKYGSAKMSSAARRALFGRVGAGVSCGNTFFGFESDIVIYTKHHLKFRKNQADNLGYM